MASNFMVLDTEGTDTVARKDDQAHPETSLFYDFGCIIVDGNTSEQLERVSFINSDVFFQEQLMTSAYYAEKLPQYRAGMGNEWEVANTLTIWQTITRLCKEHKVREVWAYNARYDRTITNHTIEIISNGFRKFFMPYGIKWRDIWDYAGSTICKTRKYVRWCEQHGYVSAKGNPSTSADTVGKYILQNLDFAEQHTALSDCDIELAILQAAKKRHQKARHSMGQGWRDAAKVAKDMRKEREEALAALNEQLQIIFEAE